MDHKKSGKGSQKPLVHRGSAENSALAGLCMPLLAEARVEGGFTPKEVTETSEVFFFLKKSEQQSTGLTALPSVTPPSHS